MLALGSDDRTITITNLEGDTVRQFSVQGDPEDIQFSEMKGNERSSSGENTVSTPHYCCSFQHVTLPCQYMFGILSMHVLVSVLVIL